MELKGKIYKILAWFEILAGLIFSVVSLFLIWGISMGGFQALFVLPVYILLSIILLVSGFLLLKSKKSGKVMSVISGLILVWFFFPLFSSLFLYPSSSQNKALEKAITGIPSVKKAFVNVWLLNDYMINAITDLEVINDSKRVDEIIYQSLELMKKISPAARNFSKIHITVRAKKGNHFEYWKGALFKFDRIKNNFIEIYKDATLRSGGSGDTPLEY